MKFYKLLLVIAALFALLVLSLFVNDLYFGGNVDKPSGNGTGGNNYLLQYEWPQFQGDSSFTRFSTGPAPEAPAILWKSNLMGVQSYISAFNGKVFVTTKTAVFALDHVTGSIIWNSTVPAPGPSAGQALAGGAFLGNGIRSARLEEFEPLMYLLNRCFGFSLGAFERYYPNIYRPTPELCASAYVVEDGGEIVSHVGLYPLEIVTHGIDTVEQVIE